MPRGCDPVEADVRDVGVARVEGLDLRVIDVERQDGESSLSKQKRERQPHVSLAHHSDARLVSLDTLCQSHVLASCRG